jgi:hypothetical protein
VPTVGYDQAEYAGIEIDHAVEVEGVKAEVAELGVGQLGHRHFSPVRVAALGNRRACPVNAGIRPGFFTFMP